MTVALCVSLVGIAVAAVGLLGVVAPDQLARLLAQWRVLTALPVTLSLRIGLGVLFLVAAPSCRFPDLVRLIGVLELVGAVVLAALGAARLQRFVEWWLGRPASFVRLWCAVALAFGSLLVYAGVWQNTS